MFSLLFNSKKYQLFGSFIAKKLGDFTGVHLLDFVRSLHYFVEVFVEIIIAGSNNIEVVQSKNVPVIMKGRILLKLRSAIILQNKKLPLFQTNEGDFLLTH